MEAGRIGWGVLGTAGVARRRFLPALQEARNGYLVAVGSRSLDRAAAVVQAAGQGRAAGSYEEVLEDPAVDAVYIPLPNSLHEPWTRKAFAAGKHVLCEKPLALRAAAVEELANAAAAAGRVVMEGFMYRLHPQYDPAVWQPLVEQTGRLRSAHVRMSYPFDRPGDIRENATLGGGALWDIGCYCLDLLTWQLGAPLEVQAMGELRNGLDWTTAGQVRFAQGCWRPPGGASPARARSGSAWSASAARWTWTARSERTALPELGWTPAVGRDGSSCPRTTASAVRSSTSAT